MKKPMGIILLIAAVVIGVSAYFFFASSDGEEQYYYSVGEPFVTNVLDSDMLIKTAVVLETSSDVGKELDADSAVVRDCILNVLRGQTEEDFRQADLQLQLSDAIVSQLNALFPQEKGNSALFTRAYFTDFVMQ
jgi:flagellar basal body-associated protein FliL